jgi:hypothetical protein
MIDTHQDAGIHEFIWYTALHHSDGYVLLEESMVHIEIAIAARNVW